jgi:hypothetical protein
MMFPIFWSISLKFLVNIGTTKEEFFQFTNSGQFGKIETEPFNIGSGCEQYDPGEDSASRHPSKH